MAVVPILQYPNKRLNTKAEHVDNVTEVQTIIDDMFETLHKTDNCAGLAATQLDFKNPKRITVIYDYRETEHPSTEQSLVLINPEVIHREGEMSQTEGCLSVGCQTWEAIKRSAKVRVSYLDRDGNPQVIEGEGFFAKLLQHEIDHLDGYIFLDRLSRLKRQRIDKRFEKHLREQEK